MLDREVARIAQADELLSWIMPQHKSRECDRCRNRFEMARRHGDDQAFDLAPPDPLENLGHGTNMPIEMKLFTRHHGLKGPTNKGYKIVPHEFVSDASLDFETQVFDSGHGLPARFRT